MQVYRLVNTAVIRKWYLFITMYNNYSSVWVQNFGDLFQGVRNVAVNEFVRASRFLIDPPCSLVAPEFIRKRATAFIASHETLGGPLNAVTDDDVNFQTSRDPPIARGTPPPPPARGRRGGKSRASEILRPRKGGENAGAACNLR